MQPAWTGGEAFLTGWAWSMHGWTKPRPAWRNTTSLPARHRDRRVHAGAGEEWREFSGFLNLRKRSWNFRMKLKRKNVNFLPTSPVHPALVLRVAGGGTATVQAEDDLGAEEKRRPTVPVAGEGEEVVFLSPICLKPKCIGLKPFRGPSFALLAN
jgi:hypothetical protein